MWTVYGTPYASGELSNTTVFQKITYHDDLVIKAMRCWVILVDNPIMTGLRMKVYGEDQQTGSIGSLLETSTNSWSTSTILQTNTSGVKEIYFEFSPFSVKADSDYFIVLNADTYTPSGSSEFAFRTVWPDPSYSLNYTATGNNFLSSPNFISAVIGAKL